MVFGEKLKEEREKRGWSQTELAEKIYVSRQSVSKWETGKNYPSIEVIIELSDLFEVTIDELLRSDEELTEKVIQDSKQLAHPKWKAFFDSLFLLGVLLILAKFAMLVLNSLVGMDLWIIEGKMMKILVNVVPIACMVIGGLGSDQLKTKYID